MDNDTKTLIKLVNPSFTFSFAGKEYDVKKASLEKVIQYQIRVDELSKSDLPATTKDYKILAYCIYLILKDVDSSITEDFISQNCPGNADILDLLMQLGFIDPKRMESIRKIQEEMQEKITTQSSSQQ